jgi:hypothetical protein
MKIKLSSRKESEFGSEIEISDQANPEGVVKITVDSWPACSSFSESVSVTADEARRIIDHLKAVFQ